MASQGVRAVLAIDLYPRARVTTTTFSASLDSKSSSEAALAASRLWSALQISAQI